MAPSSTRRSSGLLRLSAVAVGAVAAIGYCAPAFVGAAPNSALRGGRVALYAEAAPAPAPAPSGESVALVKITEESSMTTASVLGGVAGLLIGGVWVGGALFAASSYLARKEDSDVSKALKGIAAGSLEALNFSSYVNDKYTVTGKIGSAITDAVNSAKTGNNKETFDSIDKFVDGAKEAIDSVDKDIGIKDTIGSVATSASELAFQAVEKVIELNDQYKITDQLKDKIDEATKSTSSKA